MAVFRAPAVLPVLVFSLIAQAWGCRPPAAPPPPAPPEAGWWYDSFRNRRIRDDDGVFLAGAAKVKLTPPCRWTRIAGHGHWRKHAKGCLDDLYARVLYLDGGSEAAALVSLDFIGWMYPRTQRIRRRITREFPHDVVIASTHNHAGPDTEGLWGSAVLGLVPLRSGIDPIYMEKVERRVARAVLEAVSGARPARLFVGRFRVPEGLAVNMREPEDMPLVATMLRVADASNGATIGTVINWGNHAEALQDNNRWLSADWPGAMCREIDLALGGVCLFFSGPAGGMIEPANSPDDPESERIAFMRRLGGAVAGAAIELAIGGMESIERPWLRKAWLPVEFPVDPGSTVSLVMRLGLLEPRPLRQGKLLSEMMLLDLGKLQVLTVPAETTPEVGRMLERSMSAPYRMIITLGLDHLGYILSERQWKMPRFHYERSMSLGREGVRILLEGAIRLSGMLEAR